MSDANTARDRYRYFVPLATRWMDNDIFGHVNNVTYYSYFDTAANNFLIREGGLDIHDGAVVGFVVASRCDYRQPLAHPEELDIGFRVNVLGNRSVQYGLAVFRRGEDEAVAFGTFTHVFVNRESGKSAAIPDGIRAALVRVLVTAED